MGMKRGGVQHKTVWQEWQDESQEHCMDCDYMRAVPKDVNGKRLYPGIVVREGVAGAHRNDGSDAGLVAVVG